MALPPVLPLFRVPTPLLIFHSYVLFGLPNILSSRLKWGTAKIYEIKRKKVPSRAGSQPLSIPLSAARNGCELSWKCSIFERSIASLPRAPDRVYFSFVPLWAHCFTLRLGIAHFAWGLALAGRYYTNIHLGDGILFGSPGAGTGTYSSRVGVGATVRLLRARQVSGYLDVS